MQSKSSAELQCRDTAGQCACGKALAALKLFTLEHRLLWCQCLPCVQRCVRGNTTQVLNCSGCRWGDDDSDEEGNSEEEAKLTPQEKQQAIHAFLKSALTETLLSVTDSLLRDAATYALPFCTCTTYSRHLAYSMRQCLHAVTPTRLCLCRITALSRPLSARGDQEVFGAAVRVDAHAGRRWQRAAVGWRPPQQAATRRTPVPTLPARPKAIRTTARTLSASRHTRRR